jgi:hypothetical protein
MPPTPRRRIRPARKATPATARSATTEHKHDPGSKRSTFSYRGRSVEIHAGDVGCCVEIDGERVDYVVEPDGIYTHDLAYQKFGSPEELAEELIRQWGQARIKRTPVPHDHGPGHDDDHDHDH